MSDEFWNSISDIFEKQFLNIAVLIILSSAAYVVIFLLLRLIKLPRAIAKTIALIGFAVVFYSIFEYYFLS